MENTLIHYDKSALVVQANELIRAQQDELTLLEAKLILLTISQIAKQDTDLKTYTCPISELADFLEIGQENIYRVLDGLTDSILTKRVKLINKAKPSKRNGEPNYKKFQWVTLCEYNDGVITIRINDELKPYLMGLNMLMTIYGFNCVRLLPSPTSIRLYQLLASYESMTNPCSPSKYANPFPEVQKQENEIIFSVEYLRQYFNCGDKYPNTGDFIKWVIDISVKGINRKAPDDGMRVSYRTAKQGRKIAYVLFKINAWTDKDFRDFLLAN